MITISVIYSILAGAAMILWGDWMVGIFVDGGRQRSFPMRTSLSGVLPGSTICRESSPSFASGVQGMGHSGAAMFAGLTEMIARTVMGFCHSGIRFHRSLLQRPGCLARCDDLHHGGLLIITRRSVKKGRCDYGGVEQKKYYGKIPEHGKQNIIKDRISEERQCPGSSDWIR